MIPDGGRFRVDDRALIWRDWGEEECAVYHRISGETHLLNPVTAATLRCLEQAALTLDELCEQIASEFDAGSPADYRPSLTDLLEHLDDLGLIRPVPSP